MSAKRKPIPTPPERASRAVKGTDTKTVLLEQVPRELFDAAAAKCRAADPPRSLKAQIVSLLRRWVNA